MTSALLVAAAFLVAGAGAAQAHARLRGSEPSASATVAVAPSVLRLAFTEVVERAQSNVLILGPDGRPVAGLRTIRDPRDATVLLTALPPGLPRGSYTVSWRVLSVDGHPVSATFRFAVGAATSPLAATTGGGFGPTALGGTGRALDDIGVLALVGLTAFPLLVAGAGRRGAGQWIPAGAMTDLLRRLRAPLAVCLLLAVAGNSLIAVDTLAQARGFPPSRVGQHLDELRSFFAGTRTGRLLWVREAGLVALGVALAFSYGPRRSPERPGRRTTGLWLHLAGSAALLGTISLSSHATTATADAWLSVAIDWSHLAAAGVWTGGLLALALAGLPAARSSARTDLSAGADQAGRLTAGFSDLAQACMLVVLATGTYEALVHVTSLGALGRTDWGGELVAKLALWVTVLLVATVTTGSLVPRVSHRAAAATARLAACGELARAVRYELAGAAALIAVAAVLAGTAPPDQLT